MNSVRATRSLVSARSLPCPLSALDAVPIDTPAAAATSLIVVRLMSTLPLPRSQVPRADPWPAVDVTQAETLTYGANLGKPIPQLGSMALHTTGESQETTSVPDGSARSIVPAAPAAPTSVLDGPIGVGGGGFFGQGIAVVLSMSLNVYSRTTTPTPAHAASPASPRPVRSSSPNRLDEPRRVVRRTPT